MAATKFATALPWLKMSSTDNFPEKAQYISSRRETIAALASGILALMLPQEVFDCRVRDTFSWLRRNDVMISPEYEMDARDADG